MSNRHVQKYLESVRKLDKGQRRAPVDQLGAARQVRANADKGAAWETVFRRLMAWQQCKIERNHTGVIWKAGKPTHAGARGRLDWTVWFQGGHVVEIDTKRTDKPGRLVFDERCRPEGPQGGAEGHQHIQGRQIAALGGKAALLVSHIVSPMQEDLYLLPFDAHGLSPLGGQPMASVAWEQLAPWKRPRIRTPEFLPLGLLDHWEVFVTSGWLKALSSSKDTNIEV